jgi:AraC-like DNA-binding protein
VHLVAHGTMPIAAIARRVGYVNAGAFARAFRRWTHASPRHYRTHGPAGPRPHVMGGGRELNTDLARSSATPS